MKKHLIISVLALIILMIPIMGRSQSSERWEEIGPVDFTAIANQSPTTLVMPTTDGFLYVSKDYGVTWEHHYIDDTLSLLDVHFIDSLHGMLISWVGDVLFTADGGSSWLYSKIPANLTRAAYITLDTAVVSDDSGFVWRTTDHGETWNSQNLLTNSLYSIYFLDTQNGFVCGSYGTFAKTNDAGATWTKQDIGAGDSVGLRAIDFLNKDTGVVGGFANGEFGHTYVTTDGGNSWLNRPMPSSWTVDLNVIKLISGISLLAAGGENDAWISSDFGLTWNNSPIGGGELINGAWYNPEHGSLIIGSFGCIESSSNDGRQWQDLNFCWNSQTDMIHFGDTLMGVDLGADGETFIRSTDQGNTWGTYNLLNEFPWTGLVFKNSLQGVAIYADANDANLATTDGGLTWANAGWKDTFNFTSYNVIARSHEATYLMFDYLGGIHSSDNGASWSNINALPSDTMSPYPNQKPANHFFSQLSACGTKNAYMILKYIDTVIGNNSDYDYHTRIFQTTDAGRRWWEFNNAPALPICYVVYFRDSMTGFMGCDSGAIFRTTDGGQNWSRNSITNNQVITSIGFLNDTLGFCGAENAQIFRTTDGGLTWRNDSLRIGNDGTSKNVSERFDQILFPDSNTVVMTTRNGFYRRKLNTLPLASVASAPGGNLFQYLYIHLYPVPTSNTLNVQLDGMYIAAAETLNCGLYDILGRHVMDLTNEAQNGNNGYTSVFSFNVNKLPDGVYTLDYSLGGYSYSHSVVVIH